MGWNTTAVCNRWFVNINEWDPCDGEWDFLLSLLPEAEEKVRGRPEFREDLAIIQIHPIGENRPFPRQ